MPSVGIEADVVWDVSANVGLEQDVLWDVDAVPADTPCADARCGAFDRVHTDHLVESGARVTWELDPVFNAPGPYSFRLQVGETGNPDASDWADVGPEVSNTFVLLDPERRAVGKQLTTHYRVRLTDGDGAAYYSAPATVLGDLGVRDWLNARDLLRQHKLRLRQFAGVRGFLLKRKRKGATCDACVDPFTGDVTDSKCPVCFGARFVAGYYRAMPCQYADVTESAVVEHRQQGPEGAVRRRVVGALFLGAPLLSSGDIWVDGTSDVRHYVESIEVKARLRGVPILQQVSMSQLAFDHAAYKVPLEGS